ncbi:MAG: YkgJ family cysteine cluster protein [Gammaproteobacteria bacterium]|nr:YkgJ family cysteine cluster protein [Gammaproteobacteria bacterium]MBL7003239.1 YkgJ family cysteine cluster protein [Gammaproteobacteria bacterium]
MITVVDLEAPLRKAIATFTKCHSTKQAIKVAEVLLDWGQNLSDDIYKQTIKLGFNNGCIKGCSYCCYQNVQITPFEAISISAWIARNLDKKSIELIYERSTNIHSINANEKSDYQRWSLREPCPCLDLKTNKCLIYEARPLNCRISSSHSRKLCENNFNDFESECMNIQSTVLLKLRLKKKQYFSPKEDLTLNSYTTRVISNLSIDHFIKLFSLSSENNNMISSDTINKITSYLSMELSSVLRFTLHGKLNTHIKSILDCDENVISCCYKTTD